MNSKFLKTIFSMSIGVTLSLTACNATDVAEEVESKVLTLAVPEQSILEGKTTKTHFIDLKLSAAPTETIEVLVSTVDGTATGGEDFKAMNGEKITFNAGAAIVSLELEIYGDTTQEENETFELHFISDAIGLTSALVVPVTIKNDDNSVVVQPDDGYLTPLSYAGMKLIWNDEFEGNALNSAYWTHEEGGHGWGNNESQYYTKGNNTTVSNGKLTIEARKESVGSNEYTSSRIITQGKFSFTYGRVDIRAKLPYGQGIWPALWMLGESFSSVGWPACGEIDIMEVVGGKGKDNTTHGTIHWDNGGSYANYGGKKTVTESAFKDQFHVFSIEWTREKIVWLLDDKAFHEVDTTPGGLSEFQAPFFLLFNVAVGGNWPGYPDATTVLPQQMVVDYVRVFQPE